MSIGVIGSATPNYSPQKTGGQESTAQLESHLEALVKKLKEIKQDDKLPPEQMKKQIATIEKKIAETQEKIARMKHNNKSDETKPETAKEKTPLEKPLDNHGIDEYV